jgi:hypothetical protein
MGHRRNCVTAVPSLFLIFMSKVFYFRWVCIFLNKISSYELNSRVATPGTDRDFSLLHHV